MPDRTKYTLSYRPKNYSPDSWIVSGGSYRIVVEIDPANRLPLNEVSSDMPRAFQLLLERTVPALMHGEYLPDLLDGEEEVVRIVLDNNEVDTWSIRARSENGLIKYKVVDEYETEYQYEPTESKEPLTFEELVSLIDSIRDVSNPDERITNPYRDYNLNLVENPDDEVEFVLVFSRFYPDLMQWYYEDAAEWLEYIKSKYPKGS